MVHLSILSLAETFRRLPGQRRVMSHCLRRAKNSSMCRDQASPKACSGLWGGCCVDGGGATAAQTPNWNRTPATTSTMLMPQSSGPLRISPSALSIRVPDSRVLSAIISYFQVPESLKIIPTSLPHVSSKTCQTSF